LIELNDDVLLSAAVTLDFPSAAAPFYLDAVVRRRISTIIGVEFLLYDDQFVRRVLLSPGG